MAKQHWNLDDKVVLITGGARGIGAATAVELARRGAQIVLWDVDEQALKTTAAELPGDVLSAVVDVRDYDACKQGVAEIISRHGHLDIVWANAGIAAGGPVELVAADIWKRVIDVNLIGVHNTVHAALESIIAAKGYVAMTASLAAYVHAPGMSAYCAAKSGVEALGNSLRQEVEHQGVGVATLHPTWIDTDMVREGDEHQDAFRLMRSKLPPPFKKTYPLSAIVPTIADAFEARKSRINLPGFVSLAYLGRQLANSRAFTRPIRKMVPRMRQMQIDQVAREGVDIALPQRWRDS